MPRAPPLVSPQSMMQGGSGKVSAQTLEALPLMGLADDGGMLAVFHELLQLGRRTIRDLT